MTTLRILGLGALGLLLSSATVACGSDASGSGQSSADIVAGGLPPQPPICGGIAGLACPSNMDCKLDGNFPDASGKCEAAPVWELCNLDTDCTAVAENACCAHGFEVSVNKKHVPDYKASFDPSTCTGSVCPLFVVEPVPSSSLCIANRCQLVANTEISCGGFTPTPHSCPDGYDCEGAGLPKDAPGRCVATNK